MILALCARWAIGTSFSHKTIKVIIQCVHTGRVYISDNANTRAANGKRYEILNWKCQTYKQNEKSNARARLYGEIVPFIRKQNGKEGYCDSCHTLKYMIHNSQMIRNNSRNFFFSFKANRNNNNLSKK